MSARLTWVLRRQIMIFSMKTNLFANSLFYNCTFTWSRFSSFTLLAPQSDAFRISAYRDFRPIPNPIPSLPLIAFEHLSLSMVIWNSPSRPRQINVEQGRPKISKISKNFQIFQIFHFFFFLIQNFTKFFKIFQIFQIFQNFQNFPKIVQILAAAQV